MAIIQNTLYLTTPGTVVVRDHLTLRIEIEKETRLTIPIHHLESICAFGQVVVTPSAMALCWKHQVAVHYHTEHGLPAGTGPGKWRHPLLAAPGAICRGGQPEGRIAHCTAMRCREAAKRTYQPLAIRSGIR